MIDTIDSPGVLLHGSAALQEQTLLLGLHRRCHLPHLVHQIAATAGRYDLDGIGRAALAAKLHRFGCLSQPRRAQAVKVIDALRLGRAACRKRPEHLEIGGVALRGGGVRCKVARIAGNQVAALAALDAGEIGHNSIDRIEHVLRVQRQSSRRDKIVGAPIGDPPDRQQDSERKHDATGRHALQGHVIASPSSAVVRSPGCARSASALRGHRSIRSKCRPG